MEQLIANIIEKSLVGGAFIYMLHYFFTQFSASLEKVTSTLDDISSTMRTMDARMQSVERRIERLEERNG